MFGRSITLFRIFGVSIRVNMGWAILAVLVAWSLAQGHFPHLYAGLPPETYWWMALAAVIGLAASIVLHELAHSLVARPSGLPLENITLFIFGGVAELEEEPRNPWSELAMALAGPLVSVALAFAFAAGAAWVGEGEARPAVAGVLDYLAMLNGVLAVFNMLPAFPLDGGRALRAILWAIAGDARFATRWAARIGAWLGLLLIVAGLYFALTSGFVGGLWWILIGLFIRSAALGAGLQTETERLLEGVPVRRLMKADPIAVGPDLTVRRFVDEHVYPSHADFFPVVRDSRFLGSIGVEEVRRVPIERWDEARIADLLTPASDAVVIAADADAKNALSKMQRRRLSRLFVVDGDQLMGTIALKDLLELLALKAALEPPRGPARRPLREIAPARR